MASFHTTKLGGATSAVYVCVCPCVLLCTYDVCLYGNDTDFVFILFQCELFLGNRAAILCIYVCLPFGFLLSYVSFKVGGRRKPYLLWIWLSFSHSGSKLHTCLGSRTRKMSVANKEFSLSKSRDGCTLPPSEMDKRRSGRELEYFRFHLLCAMWHALLWQLCYSFVSKLSLLNHTRFPFRWFVSLTPSGLPFFCIWCSNTSVAFAHTSSHALSLCHCIFSVSWNVTLD